MGSTGGSIEGVKLSVSLSDEDVEFLDAYALAQGLASRSSAVHHAVLLLRRAELRAAYDEAWESWSSSDAEPWESTAADGVGH